MQESGLLAVPANAIICNGRRMTMDFYQVPIGFGLALSSNTAAMNRYAHLTEEQKQEVLDRAHNVRSEMEMYTLVANLANGWTE